MCSQSIWEIEKRCKFFKTNAIPTYIASHKMFVHKYTYKRSIQLIKILTNHSLRSIHCNVWFIITSFKLLRHFFLSRDLFLFSAFSMCFFSITWLFLTSYSASVSGIVVTLSSLQDSPWTHRQSAVGHFSEPSNKTHNRLWLS